MDQKRVKGTEPEIPAGLVKELRDKTGVGIMECRKALIEAEADLDKAVEILKYGQLPIESRGVANKSVKGNLQQCWKKGLADMGLEGLPLEFNNVQIALDAERLVFCGKDEVYICNFNGTKERSIKVVKPIFKMAVTQDCARIIVWTPGRWGKDVLAYDPQGQIELEVESYKPAGKELSLTTSLDGRLFAAINEECINVWDRDGNKLLAGSSAWDPQLFLGKEKFRSVGLSPNGKYLAFIIGGMIASSVGLIRIPEIHDLLKLSDPRARTELWMANYERVPIDVSVDSALCMADNRLAIRRGRSICVFGIDEKYRPVVYDHELADKPEHIETLVITSNGRYLYYTSTHKKKKSFSIFDVESKSAIRDILVFPECSRTKPYFYTSHDGSKLIMIEVIAHGRFASETMISMLNVW